MKIQQLKCTKWLAILIGIVSHMNGLSGDDAIPPTKQVHVSVTTKQLVPNESLGVHVESPLMLEIADPGLFRTPHYRVRWNDSFVEVNRSGKELRFPEVSVRRRNRNNLAQPPAKRLQALKSNDGVLVSNIGVSMAVTVHRNGKRFALLSFREDKERLMLLSGYVESGNAANGTLFWENAARELGEEILLVDASGRVMPIEVAAGPADSVGSQTYETRVRYPSLTYSEHPIRLTSCDLPAYLTNYHPSSQINVDGQILSADFQYAQQWNSAQIVFSFECEWDNEVAWAFHAEDKLDSNNPSQLVTLLARRGLVLVELDSQKQLTSQFFLVSNGNLAEFKLTNSQLAFSEAFAKSPMPTVSGYVNSESIPLSNVITPNRN